MRSTSAISVSLCLSLLLISGCWTSGGVINRVYPQDKTYSPEELSTLLLYYPLKPASFDGKGVKEIGGEYTAIEMLPGEHSIGVYSDTRQDWFDYKTTYYTSGKSTINFQAQAGWLQVIGAQCVEKNCDKLGFVSTDGPCPFKTGEGHLITLDMENVRIIVERKSAKTEYKIPYQDGYDFFLLYSPDSRHLALKAKKDDGQYLIKDGVAEGPYTRIIAMVWSRDSRRFAYAVSVKGSDNKFVFYFIIDGKRSGPFDAILKADRYFFFDAAGELSYGYQLDNDWYRVRGGKTVKAGKIDEAVELLKPGRQEHLQWRAMNFPPPRP